MDGFGMGLLRSIRTFLWSNLLAGLFIAVPFAITVILLVWVWQQVDGPLAQIIALAEQPHHAPWTRILEAIKVSHYREIILPLVSLGLVLAVVVVLGIVTRSIIGRVFLQSLENLVARLPVVGLLYTSLRQLSEALASANANDRFKRAVAVQFPYRGCWAIGFVAGRADRFMPRQVLNGELAPESISVFVPTTPFPTAGFMIVVPENETIALEMSVKEAFKFVVSIGMAGPGKTHVHLPGLTQFMNTPHPDAKTNVEPGVQEERK